MWYERMTLEVWFDRHQYEVDLDIGESAIEYSVLGHLELDLSAVELRYGHHHGRPDLREVIAEQYPGLDGSQILVTTGAAEANFCIVNALIGPRDHVIVEHPNYPSLYHVPQGLGADVSLFPLEKDDAYRFDMDRLESMLRPETKLVSLTHPNNPTGSMIDEQSLREIVAMVESHPRATLLMDETYRDLADHPLPSASTLSPRVVSISTMSKAYGLPGIRVGWAATQDPVLLEELLAIREQVSISNNAVGEEIACSVLRRRDRHIMDTLRHIRWNKSLVREWISSHPRVTWAEPIAGVVCLPSLEGISDDAAEDFYRTLAVEYGTFVVPGRCFGMDRRSFRLGFGTSTQTLREGLDRFDVALARF